MIVGHHKYNSDTFRLITNSIQKNIAQLIEDLETASRVHEDSTFSIGIKIQESKWALWSDSMLQVDTIDLLRQNFARQMFLSRFEDDFTCPSSMLLEFCSPFLQFYTFSVLAIPILLLPKFGYGGTQNSGIPKSLGLHKGWWLQPFLTRDWDELGGLPLNVTNQP